MPEQEDPTVTLAEAGKKTRRLAAEAVGPNSMVQPSPSLVLVGTAKASTGGASLVVLRIESVTGSHIVTLDPDSAIDVGRRIGEVAHRAKSGLVVPSGGLATPT